MTEDDLTRWLGETPAPALHELEAAIWRRAERRAAEDRRLATIGVWQGGALAIAAVASLSWGMMSAAALATPQAMAVFSPHMASAPSTRLIGPAG